METNAQDLESRIRKLERLVEDLHALLVGVRPVIGLPFGYEVNLEEERDALLKVLAGART